MQVTKTWWTQLNVKQDPTVSTYTAAKFFVKKGLS